MYAQAPSSIHPLVVAWHAMTPPGGQVVRVLPDGCLDLIWRDGAVFVAGPDTAARLHPTAGGTRFAALRFAAGTGPPLLRVPADALTDRAVPLAEFWPAAEVRRLAGADDPLAALEAVVRRRWRDPDPTLVALAAGARAGRPVAALAETLQLSPRQLHRRCQTSFGYGPKALGRILRLRRALALAVGGHPFAQVAADAGYADQAHLCRDVRALAGVPLRTLVG
ncbi:AraC-like DNA-binding protein [Krasilnikovia cinnamomea]|uniref:AraC-like DNA-binding protein n=1 Tax=Krasilnikovia cinnamomea TaxID=349313 RepID=A0A4Q7ZPL8_9ACTN|nr:helix-turn-helix domain-containing protein [Krasilnikovia cinnamomea]RZU52279.1 AraC-like DNA-binding protein [Krasilnikovia cinnamomea]